MLIKTLHCVSLVLRSQKDSKYSFLQRKASFILSLDFCYWRCLVVGCWHEMTMILFVAPKAGALLVINIFLELTVCLRLTGSFRIHFLSQNYFQYAAFCWCMLKSFSLWIDRFSFPVPMYIYRISHDPWSLCIYNFGKVPMLSLTIKSEKVWLNFW